ncbi:hypothetical protein [Rubellicoccus peritrichatus]|uniref:Teneurin-like YD-shell domain-containing protein n=1 Tax=Rubellicoccus peritrichatus TaxID=3080537 RepID=A0AAQ3LD97_9BACT|nr:hypothetical protein [Puniceicoccus sp. CR14]WOO42397.1 hypothetical protein RZN69_04795 [Puniceicoccus sp. CR14]
MRHQYIIILLLAVVSVSAENWKKQSLSLGRLGIDGSLSRSFTLGSLGGSPEFSFPIMLEHSLSDYPLDEYETFSLWTVPQLTTYVVPVRRGQIIWVAPGGREMVFGGKNAEHLLLKTVPAELPKGWTAIRNDEDKAYVRILSHDGWEYTYRDGAIQALTAPTGRKLYFGTDLTLITSIEQRLDGEEPFTLLDAKYDDLQRLQELRIGPHWHIFEYQDDTELITSWIPFDERARSHQFEYRNGLTSAIEMPSGYRERYDWITDILTYAEESELELDHATQRAILVMDNHFLYRYGAALDGINLISRNALGQDERIAYNPLTNRLKTVERGGITREVRWNPNTAPSAQGLLDEVTAPDGKPVIELEYDENDNASLRKERGKAPISFTWDDQGRLLETAREGYPPTRYTYAESSDKPKSVTDPSGEVIEFQYNDRGELVQFKDKAGGLHGFEYDRYGRLNRRIYPMDLITAWEYDEHGRTIRQQTPGGNTREFTYNDYNQLESVKDGSVTWTYEYDARGRLSQTLRNGKPWKSYERVSQNGNERIGIIDPEGQTTVRTYDLEGKLLQEINPLAERIDYHYDPAGQITGWEDSRGAAITFNYNDFGQIALQENSEGQKREWTFDSIGQLEKIATDPTATAVDYDEHGRVRRVEYGPNEVMQYTYDAYGRIEKATTGTVSTDYAYDEMDRKTGERVTYPDGSRSSLIYTYTPAGLKETTRYKLESANGKVIENRATTYRYDTLGRMTEMAINGAWQVRYVYAPAGFQLSSKLMANGVTIDYGYNEMDRLASIVSRGPKGEELKAIHYLWDESGRLNRRTIHIPD